MKANKTVFRHFVPEHEGIELMPHNHIELMLQSFDNSKFDLIDFQTRLHRTARAHGIAIFHTAHPRYYIAQYIKDSNRAARPGSREGRESKA